MPNFADIAKKKVEEAERPPLPPIGHYRWQVTKIPSIETTADGKNDIVTFPVRVAEALEDVEVSDYPGDIRSVTNSIRFWFNKEDEAEFAKTEFRLRTFLEKHLRCCGEGDSFQQALNASVNQDFIAAITWTPDKNDPEIVYANIGKTAPVE